MFFLIVDILFGGGQILAQSCKSFFIEKTEKKQTVKPNQELKDLIHKFRQSKISRSKKGQIITVNDTHYVIEGTLGKGTSVVYLAHDSKGVPVSIKIIRSIVYDRNWPNTAFYEIAATKFFIESGERVPRILNFATYYNEKGQITKSIIVKEYIEGVTYEDLHWLTSYRAKNWIKHYSLIKNLQPELRRLLEVFKGFSSWLTKNQIDLTKHPFKQLDHRLQSYDSAQRNFIYSPETQSWILFDP